MVFAMRSKTILSTAAFIVAFVASAAFASLFITKTQTAPDYFPVSSYKSTSCFKDRNNFTTANKISALIREDINNGRESGRRLYRAGAEERPPFTDSKFPKYAEAVERYADASGSIKAGSLPSDFQTHWREHMKAWRDYSEFLNRMKDSSAQRGWTNEELEAVDDFHGSAIERTWQTVLQTGVSYGADVR
jgi:hypothetical protein